MEHLKEILRVWADLHNKPSKSTTEKRIMDELAALLARRGGEPFLHKMRIVRAGGTLEFAHVSEVVIVKAIKEVTKRANKAVKEAPHITGFAASPVERFTDREAEIVSFVDEEEKKSPQSNADPANVAEVKRGRKAKVKN